MRKSLIIWVVIIVAIVIVSFILLNARDTTSPVELNNPENTIAPLPLNEFSDTSAQFIAEIANKLITATR